MAAFSNALGVQLLLQQLPTGLGLVVLSESRHSFPVKYCDVSIMMEHKPNHRNVKK